MSFLRLWWWRLTVGVDISGDWTLTVWEHEVDCPATGVTKQTYPVTLTQRGDSVDLSPTGGGTAMLSGRLEGRVLALSGRYSDEGRTTEEHVTAVVNGDATGIAGGSVWTWGVADGDPGTCAGTTTLSAVRA